MLWLREVLAAHQSLLALLHGQAFFVLGLSIVFLAHRSARLEIARGFTLLAVFGFCEALAAWSSAWPVPLSDLAPWLAWSRLLLLGLGYAFLLAFAVQTYGSSGRPRNAGRISIPARGQWALVSGLLVLWLVSLAVARLVGVPSKQIWLGGEIAVRYGLALPGGLIGALGLRHQAHRTIDRERLPLIRPHLRVIGIALGFFALFGGLIGPPAHFSPNFLPANWLNEELLLQVTGIPVSLFRGLCGIAITYGIVRALSVILNEIELWLEGVERRQALARERERIGRELHDGIIQSIYAAGLILEGARHSISNEPEAAHAQLTRAIASLNQTIQDIRRYIFDLRGEMPSDNLETGLRKIINDFRINTLLEIKFVVEGEGKDTLLLGAERRQHIFQITREALTNVARHAQARRVEVSLRYSIHALKLCISDDGIGLSALPINRKGEGLRNIRERARLLDGMLDIDTAPGKGTMLTLTVPY
ncbi:MAG: histidine kinase [Chloroflexota bacterium]|nr:histidine kinase [Chloroflexota bacterium]